METAVLKSELREATGSRACTKLRRQGRVPAILYGRAEPSVMLTVSQHDLNAVLHTGARMLDLATPDRTEKVFVKDVQYDSMGSEIVHVDFTRVVLTETIELEVAVNLHGRPLGVLEGGIVDQVIKELRIECLPTQIPDGIRVEVGQMKVGDMITVGNLQIPEGVKVLNDPGLVVVTIHAPVAEEVAVEAAEAAEETAEPEVIGAKEREEAKAAEGEEEAEKPGKE